MIIGIISWLRHQDKEDDVVIINTLSKKEIILVIGSQLFLFWAYYFLLKMFNTDLLILSSCSIVTSVLASYFEARRSELSLFCYIANDLTDNQIDNEYYLLYYQFVKWAFGFENCNPLKNKEISD